MTKVLLSNRGITRTQSGFVVVDKMMETPLKLGMMGQECGGFSVPDSKTLKAKPASEVTSCIVVCSSNSFSLFFSHRHKNQNDLFAGLPVVYVKVLE